MDRQNLKIVSWNANSIKDKKMELQDFIHNHRPDIVLLQETFLKSNDKFGMPNYITYRTDRDNGRGGGVAILTHKNLQHKRIENYNAGAIENVAIEIKVRENIWKIASVYIPPSKTIRNEDIETIMSDNTSKIIGGDLNAKSSTWRARITNSRGRLIQTMAQRHNFVIYAPEEPTHYTPLKRPDILDIFMVKNINYTMEIEVINELSSDHTPVLLTTQNWQNYQNNVQSKTNWKSFAEKIQAINRPIPNISSVEEIENEVKQITNEIQTSYNQSTKKIPTKDKDISIPQEIKDMIKIKNRAVRRASVTGYPPDKIYANQLRTLVKKELDEHRNSNWNNLLESLNDEDNDHKKLWAWKKKTTKQSNSIKPIHGERGLVYSDKNKATAFADSLQLQFQENQNREEDIEETERTTRTVIRYLNRPDNSNLRETNTEEIKSEITRLKTRKAPGEDLITNKMLKIFAEEYLHYIVNLINSILKNRHFPDSWKNAIIILIPKPGKNHTHPENHRPISLLNTLAKLTERIILTRLNEEIIDKNVIPMEQFGFQPELSTELQALRLTEDIHKSLDLKHSTAAAFLDISKAFDKAWHQGILYKLIKNNISPGLIKLLHSYLKNRTFQVRTGTAISRKYPQEAGVPQGGVLSPILYNILTADIPTTLSHTKVYTFADDTAILSQSANINQAVTYLQRALDHIQSWAIKWKLKINPNKTQAIIFTNKREVPSKELKINEHRLEFKPTIKYLGIRFDSKLTWSGHANQTIDKVENRFMQLYPYLNRKSKLNLKNKKILYNQCIRPIITYGSVVWGTMAKSHLNMVETAQSKILRVIAKAPWYMRNANIREDLQIESIKQTIKKRNIDILQKAANHKNQLLSKAVDYTPVINRVRRRPKAITLLD